MMNVSKLSTSIREEDQIPYPSSPPPFTIITANHHDGSIQDLQRKKSKNKNKTLNIKKKIKIKKTKKISIKGSYILRRVEENATLSCVDKDCHL